MQIEPEIVLRNVPEPQREAVQELVTRELEKLERYSDEIVGARAAVEVPHRTHQKGNLYHVSVELSIPGKDVMVKREPREDHAHEDVAVAIRDAFKSARRQLEDRVRKSHHRVKHHEVPTHGRVLRIDPKIGYGFLETREGRQVYFHRNAVVGDAFDRLELGTLVRFTEPDTPAENGPQASTVRLEGRHSHAVGPE